MIQENVYPGNVDRWLFLVQHNYGPFPGIYGADLQIWDATPIFIDAIVECGTNTRSQKSRM